MSGSRAIVLYDFEAQPNTSEMSIKTDETIVVTRQDVGEGWWEGRNEVTGHSGLFPAGYVEIINDSASSIPPPFPAPQLAYNSMAMPLQPTPVSAPISVSGQQFDGGDDGWGDEDWDDDDSQTSTNAGDSVQSSSWGPSGTASHQPVISGPQMTSSSSSNALKQQNAVRKSYNRFSTFVKSGGEDYMLGKKSQVVPSDCYVEIIESNGEIMWAPNQHPYTCVISKPKKESKMKGLKTYIAYQVTPGFNNIEVSRRYKHFDWLHSRLEIKYMPIPIPPLPDKQIAGRYHEDFIEHRMAQLQMWVNRLCRHPVLSQSDVWMHFITSAADEKRWKAGKRRAEKDDLVNASFFFAIQPPTNSSMDVTSIEKQVDSFGRFIIKMDDAVKVLSATACDQSKKFAGPYRREFSKMAMGLNHVATAFSISGKRDMDQKLNEAIVHTSIAYEKIGKLYEDQPKNDFEYVVDVLHEYKGMLAAWPDILQIHKGALNRKREHIRLHDEGRIDASTLGSVAQRADVVTYATMAEINQFQAERIKDFKEMMTKFLLAQMKFYQNIVNTLHESVQLYQ